LGLGTARSPAVPLRARVAVRQRITCAHSSLFITEGRRHFGEGSLATLLEDVKAIAGLEGDRRIKPHSIRHAAATRLPPNGADIRSIQTWLGHSQLQTIAIYLHTDEQQVCNIAPLAGLRKEAEEPARTPSGRPRLVIGPRRKL